MVIEVTKLVNAELSPNHISIPHRLPNKIRHSLAGTTGPTQDAKSDESPSKLSSIIVKIVSRDTRNQILGNRNLLCNAVVKNFFVVGTKNVFMNENLTHARKKLFWNRKQKAKASQYKYCWTSSNNIFVKWK